MKLRKAFLNFLIPLMAAFLWTANPASAVPTLFNAAWDGSSFGNTAMITGTVTIDPDNVMNPGGIVPFDTFISGVNLTVTGASSGNGTFTTADFSGYFWNASAPIDFSMELVGQAGWIDFNLFNSLATAPRGTAPFRLTTNGGTGDNLILTSLAPAAVPELNAGGAALPLALSLCLFLLLVGDRSRPKLTG